MAHRLPKRSALLAKIESVYGTDPVPTGAANAMYVYDLAITPVENVYAPRMPVRPFFGADAPLVGGTPVKVTFKVPIAGGGAAGTAPGFGVLLRGCARSEVVTGGVDVTYGLISSAFESVAFYVSRDGVRHIITGSRGTVSRDFSHNQMPMYNFSFTGIYNAPTDTALPTLTFGATWPKPVVQNRVNTTTFTLHGFAGKLSKLSFDDGIDVNWKDYVNATEDVRVTGRAAPVKGSVSIEADSLASKDWFAISRAGTLGALALQHGPAGNQYRLDAANVLILNPAEEEEDGILMYKLGLEFYPSATGNDEFIEKFK